MQRVTVEQVLEAYRATGCKPTVNQLHGMPGKHDEKNCCGIGVLLFAKGCDPQHEDFDSEAKDMFERAYLEGFYEGFDGGECGIEGYTDEQWMEGWQDGNASALAVFNPAPSRRPR